MKKADICKVEIDVFMNESNGFEVAIDGFVDTNEALMTCDRRFHQQNRRFD